MPNVGEQWHQMYVQQRRMETNAKLAKQHIPRENEVPM